MSLQAEDALAKAICEGFWVGNAFRMLLNSVHMFMLLRRVRLGGAVLSHYMQSDSASWKILRSDRKLRAGVAKPLRRGFARW
jgi:hypothetical protein